MVMVLAGTHTQIYAHCSHFGGRAVDLLGEAVDLEAITRQPLTGACAVKDKAHQHAPLA